MNRLGRVLGGCVVGLLLLSVGKGAAQSPALSSEEQRRVEAGDIVVLDVLPPGASASAEGGTVVALVCASPAVVWDILVDWPNQTRLYPRVTAVEVIQTDASRVRVRYTLGVGPFSFHVYMDKHPDPVRRRSTWRLAEDPRSTFFSESSGYWQVDEAGVNSRVTHGVATRTIVPAFLTRGSHRDSLVATVQALRTRAQGTVDRCSSATR